MLKKIYIIAIFVLGLSSPILVHILHIIVGFISSSLRGGVMSGIIASFPYNAIAFIAFFASLGFIIWYLRQSKKRETDEENAKNKLMEETIRKAVRDAFDEANKTNTTGEKNGS
ncbi:hypothetical protein ACFLUB_00285 [Chloroflexota bacterium]